MKFVFGIFSLLIVTIRARGTPKIEIFEIRENENGLVLKNLNSNPSSQQRSESLIKLLRGSKTDDQATKFAKQLLSKLKSLRGEEKSNLYTDDANIYIVNSDLLDDEGLYSEEAFIDKTRNERTNVNIDKNEIRDVLLQMLQPDNNSRIQPQKKKKLRESLKRPMLMRTNDVEEKDRNMAPGPGINMNMKNNSH